MYSSEPANAMSCNPGAPISDVPILEQVDSIRTRLEGVNYVLCKVLEMINFDCLEPMGRPMVKEEPTSPVKGLGPEIRAIDDMTCMIEAQAEMIVRAIGGNVK